MQSDLLDDLISRASALPAVERLRLAARLVEQVTQEEARSRLKWGDARGAVPSLLAEEDAQSWVSKTRRDSDSSRDHRR